MGAHPYQYVVDFEEDVQAALDKLRRGCCRRANTTVPGVDPVILVGHKPNGPTS